MTQLRKVLIVDDVETNRIILKSILKHDYSLLEAESGMQALELIRRYSTEISAVLLDIIMPVVDGYEVLMSIRNDPMTANIPVIVTTGNTDDGAEVKALSMGANDYIAKPYTPAVIKHRLYNTIMFRETAAIANLNVRDDLTGLYNRRAFFEKASEMINEKPEGYYVLGCFDINGFKIINDQYGTEMGDYVLKSVAEVQRKGFEKIGGICCRIMADKFAALYPAEYKDSNEMAYIRRSSSVLDGTIMPITFSIGHYIVNDKTLPVSAMYERAAIAEISVKGRFDRHIALYDESMRTKLIREQEITSEMNTALMRRHFEVWLQPQFNHATGALIGAEALVRWRHPERGLISPGEFIPVFERNGFIYELDKYVWRETCAMLRRWLDEGRMPMPVSVNISRYDLFKDDLTDLINGLIEEYCLPVDLLRLEITESAFAQSAERVVYVVQQFIDLGFTVEIDDFGSGYSSLNALKEVPANVLKLDMRFLENDENSQRGGNILESIVRMARWIGMAVIAEGVETVEQADYLKSIGCSYVQGYLYAKPMPVVEYEQLARTKKIRESKMLAITTVEKLDNNSFWDPNSMDSLIFNSYISGACIFEYYKGNIELLRASNKYISVLDGNITLEEVLALKWNNHLDNGNSTDLKKR